MDSGSSLLLPIRMFFNMERTQPIGNPLGKSWGAKVAEVSRGWRLRAPLPLQNGLNPLGLNKPAHLSTQLKTPSLLRARLGGGTTIQASKQETPAAREGQSLVGAPPPRS